ncbi:MAG: DUF4259 domain-containing protein [Flammeovirgaceae bacterium]
MGAWSVDAFGNDDACDWAYELEKTKDTSYVEATLSKVLLVGAECLEASEACEGIAAAEVVERMQGNFGLRDSYTETVDNWVTKLKITSNTELNKKAHAVLDRVLSEPSELLELWRDSDEYNDWKDSINNIKSRINI